MHEGNQHTYFSIYCTGFGPSQAWINVMANVYLYIFIRWLCFI